MGRNVSANSTQNKQQTKLMGYKSFSTDDYAHRTTMRADVTAKTGKDATFAYDTDIKSGKIAAKVSDRLTPSKKNSVGKVIRESLDSTEHPESLPIAIMIDVTGSGHNNPRIFQAALPKLMALLIAKGYVPHPHILFGAIGDAFCDQVPLQMGQFESGLEMDDDLTNMYLEGRGGGHITESYELAMYFLARFTKLDSLDKRGKKGYCFFLGDEAPYAHVRTDQVKALIGFDGEEPAGAHLISTEAIMEELKEKFEVFYVNPGGSSWYQDNRILDEWRKLIGQNVIDLPDPNNICEFIASQIAICEGKIDLDGLAADLADAGVDKKAIESVSRAIVPSDSTVVAKGSTSGGTLVPDGHGAAPAEAI